MALRQSPVVAAAREGRPRPGQRATSMSEPASGPQRHRGHGSPDVPSSSARAWPACWPPPHCARTPTSPSSSATRLPDGPEPRKGAAPGPPRPSRCGPAGPARWRSCCRGCTDAWLAAGARRIPLPTGLVSLSAAGLAPALARDGVHDRVQPRSARLGRPRPGSRRGPRITVLERTELLGLEGDASRVTGVRVRTAEGEEQVLDRRSGGGRLRAWFARPPPGSTRWACRRRRWRRSTPDSRTPAGSPGAGGHRGLPRGQCAAGRVAAGAGAERDHRAHRGRALAGDAVGHARTASRPALAEEFESFARDDPGIRRGRADRPRRALTDVVVTRSTINRRRFFEKVSGLARGLRRDRRLGRHVQPDIRPRHVGGRAGRGGAARAGRRARLAAPGLARRVQSAVARPGVHWPGSWPPARTSAIPEAIGKRPEAVAEALRPLCGAA